MINDKYKRLAMMVWIIEIESALSISNFSVTFDIKTIN